MKLVKTCWLVLYTCCALGANAALAESMSSDQIEALKTGEMRKLAVHAQPIGVSPLAFTDEDGGEHFFEDYLGKVLLVNFWATWCAPCRAEMPSLDAIQADLGGDDFEVLTIATGRNPLPAIKSFFSETKIENLPVLLDPRQSLARNMGVLGLPATMIIDQEGREVARLTGDAEWHSADAVALIQAIIDSKRP
jgi:thiol-disulfide isomerase/thioredoxin